ncbi:LOW QUALITY PROTEIN: hypothetical protein U9M48_043718, partial [Paspalum notatum var. saurae]
MLLVLIKRAKSDGQIRGIVPNVVDVVLSILQYADDTVIFMDHDLDMTRNMKLLLRAFEHLSGPKINFNKSELYWFGHAHHRLDSYMEMFRCKRVPNYLGIPIRYKKLQNADWKNVEETEVNKRKKKCRLAKWCILSLRKDQGGIGIHELGTKNILYLANGPTRLRSRYPCLYNIARPKITMITLLGGHLARSNTSPKFLPTHFILVTVSTRPQVGSLGTIYPLPRIANFV